MNRIELKRVRYERRNKRVRGKINGSVERPRLTIFRSSEHIYAQVIDDTTERTLASASTVEKDIKSRISGMTKTEQSKVVGAVIAERAKAVSVSKVAFDRNGFLYHGRVKALADAARESGLDF